jgi:hypothetical protein
MNFCRSSHLFSQNIDVTFIVINASEGSLYFQIATSLLLYVLSNLIPSQEPVDKINMTLKYQCNVTMHFFLIGRLSLFGFFIQFDVRRLLFS